MITAVFGAILWFVFVPPPALLPGETTLPAAQANYRITLTVQDDADNARLPDAIPVIEQRLTALGISPFAVQLVDVGLMIEVALPETMTLDTLIPTLIMPGLLELVDFSGLTSEQVGLLTLNGTVIQTTGQQAANVMHSKGILNPLTDAPFETLLTSADITSAEVIEGSIGGWMLVVQFTPNGAAIIESHTTANIGQPLAVVLDGVVRSAPIIQAAISTEAVIEGGMMPAEDQYVAQYLAAVITIGALPVPLEVVGIEAISTITTN
jgi:preprotein translocase subunit SecD